MLIKQAWMLIRKTVDAWVDDYAPSMGAALAYYTMVSIAPLLVIVIAVAGAVFGAEAARGEILGQLQDLMGESGAAAVEGLLKSAGHSGKGGVAAVVGIVALAIGATTVVGELQSALNRIWRAPAAARTQGWWALLRARLLSFGLILVIGFLLLASMVVSASLSALGKWWGQQFGQWESALRAIDFVVSFTATSALFAMIYKFLPRARISWQDVWIGAAVTSLLFTVGKVLIGLYLAKSSVTSVFGAVGSIAVMLVWVYYSAQIFLLGAEFTWVYAHEMGSCVAQGRPPSPHSIPGNPSALPNASTNGS